MSELINIKKLKEEQVYYLEINQPEKRNILSAVVIHELTRRKTKRNLQVVDKEME